LIESLFVLNITGGQSKTLMLMNVSPVEKNMSETCATLSFAQRVMSVELGPARKRTLAASVSLGNSWTNCWKIAILWSHLQADRHR